jgi:hypothetical protein
VGADLDGLGLPGYGRVVFAFLFTVALAVAAAYALRRTWPIFLKRSALGVGTPGTTIRPLARSAVSRTMLVHLVEIDGVRVLIAENRNSIGVTVMPPGRPSGTESTP